MNKNITADKLIRNYNLHILTGIELDVEYRLILRDLEELLGNLQKYKVVGYKYLTYYGMCKENILIETDKQECEIWVHKHKVYGQFRLKNEYLSVGDIYDIIHWYILHILNLDKDVYKRLMVTEFLCSVRIEKLIMVD